MGKYFKYAIGEILLVVIGILIAFQVNSWKDERSNRKREYKILKGLLKEFENAEDELKRDSITRSYILKSVDYSIKVKNEAIPFPESYDTISSTLNNIKTYRFYSPSHPQLKDLQSSGRLDLLSSEETIEALLEYIEWWDRVSTLEQNAQNSIISNLHPYLSENCDLSLLDSKQPEQQQELIAQFKKMTIDPTFGSILRLRLESLYTLIFYSEDLMNNINNCKNAISNDLKQYD